MFLDLFVEGSAGFEVLLMGLALRFTQSSKIMLWKQPRVRMTAECNVPHSLIHGSTQSARPTAAHATLSQLMRHTVLCGR